jgi:hypothetical protein
MLLLRRLLDGGSGEAGGAAIGGEVETGAGGAVLGVGLEFVLDVGYGAGGVALVELEGAVALFAAELGVAIEDGVGDGFDLPERLIAAGCANAATLYFTLVELLWDGDYFGGHGGFPGAGFGRSLEALCLFYA